MRLNYLSPMKFSLLLLLASLLILTAACDETTNAPCAEPQNTYSPEFVLEQTIQTNVENMGNALNSVFYTLLDDSLSRAEFTQDLFQDLHYFDAGTGYFFVETLDGYLIADPSLPDMLGEWRWEAQDENGVYFVQNMIDVARFNSMGWVNYSFTNPATGMVEAKHTAVKLIPSSDWFIASGYYESQVGELDDMATSEFNDFMYRQLVNTFAGMLSNMGQHYSPEGDFFLNAMREMVHHVRFGIDYSGYFFVYTMEGVNVAYGPDPSREGTDMIDFQDATGVYIVQQAIQMLEAEGEGYLDYVWENPVTGEVEPKRSYLKLIEPLDMYVGSGVYLEQD